MDGVRIGESQFLWRICMRTSFRRLMVAIMLIAAFCMITASAEEMAPIPTGLKLSRTTYSNSVGKSCNLYARVMPISVAADTTVTWSSNDETIATVEAIDGYSSHWAKVTLKRAGKATITATVEGTTIKKSCKVVSRYVPVSAFRLKQTTLKLNPRSEYQLKAEFRPSNASDKSVHYSSDNPQIASVDENGLVTAGEGEEGKILSTTIHATTYNGKRAQCKVYVGPVPAKSISIYKLENGASVNKKTVTLANKRPDKALQLTATVSPSNVLDPGVEWESDNTDVAQITLGEGNTCVVTPVGIGSATIYAKARGNDKVKTSFKVKVKDVPVSKITLSGGMTVNKGETLRITATVSPDNASNPTVTFSATDGLNLTPVEGKSKSVDVSAADAGTYEIIASAGSKSVKLKVEVRDPDARKYRALVIAGFSNPKGSGYLPFIINNIDGMQDALRNGSAGAVQYGNPKVVRNLRDKTQLKNEIRNAFKDADSNDVSVLYLGTHGYTAGYVRTQYGAVIRFREILDCLKSVKGDVVIFMASCHSGYLRNYAKSVLGSARLRRINIFCSTGVATSSPYVSYKNYPSLSYDHFTRALTQALGFDMITDSTVAMAADGAGDGVVDNQVTLGELDAYLRAQVPESVKASKKNHEAGYLKNGNALPPYTWVSSPGLVIASRAEEG
jgi:uncharacterized protein YjdB